MTESPQQPIDFTMMYVTHNALRRDLSRFATAVAANRAATPGVRLAGRTSRPNCTFTTPSKTTTSGRGSTAPSPTVQRTTPC